MTKLFIPWSRILYIYEEKTAASTSCHVVLEGQKDEFVILDDFENIQRQIREKGLQGLRTFM